MFYLKLQSFVLMARINTFKFCRKYIDLAVACLLVIGLLQYINYNLYQQEYDDNKRWWAYHDTKDLSKPNTFAFEDAVREKANNPPLNYKFTSKKEKKLILFQHPPFGEYKSYPVDEERCGACEVSYDSNLREQAHAVVYHFAKIDSEKVTRSFPDQLLVWMNLENPWTTLYKGKIDFRGYDDLFNLTMTYRRDSDVYFPYFTLRDIADARTESDMTSKTKLVAWVVGNCIYTKGARKRLEIVKRLLQLGLEVDIFGSCVFRSVPDGWPALPHHLADYKFYLSFENGFHCRDYITEKAWWNALHAGTVPVIWGPRRADVEALLPENSYVFVEDFDRPEDLVKRLRYLDEFDSEYAKLFTWRKNIHSKLEQRPLRATGFCQMCLMLYNDERITLKQGFPPARRVESLKKYWYDREDPVCMSNQKEPLQELRAWYLRFEFVMEFYFHLIVWQKFYVIASLCVLVLIIVRRVSVLMCCSSF